MVALTVLPVVFRHYFLFKSTEIGLLLRKTLTSLLYRKILRLSPAVVAQASAGKLVNLASGDIAYLQASSVNLGT